MYLNNWLIYGANGFTAKLIIEEAVKRGHQPVLAGRTESKVLQLAKLHKLPYKIFDCSHSYKISQYIDGVDVVLNCAGPFEETAAPLREACLEAGVHYLDITGEINVLADSLALHEQAKEKGIAIISGVGFDVVPTDVLAVKTHELLPTATHLELAFAGRARVDELTLDTAQENAKPAEKNSASVSPGTSKTILRMLPSKGKVRRGGEVITVPLAAESKLIQFDDKARYCMTIPWGDVETAFHSTGIANITTFTETPKKQVQWLKRLSPIAGIFAWNFLQNLMDRMINKHIQGPSIEAIAQGQMTLVATVSTSLESQSLYATCDEGYGFSVTSALYFVESLLAHKILPGAYTPTQAVEPDTLVEMLGIQLSAVK
ncbi:MAG: saccharopine dehydrogenase NADP-binding domain-containing protein [Sinobacterium sp.]|nr:saccharopine dehydrogenase NADP-binding domain-containing protein [Sinobacterium sp.]